MGNSIASTNKLAKQVAETLAGIRIVKAYGQEDRETDRAGVLIDARTGYFFKAQQAGYGAAPMTDALAGVGIAAALYYGGTNVLAGNLDGAHFMAFITTMLLAFQPMRTISALPTQMAQGLRAADKLCSAKSILSLR